jgi:hypothetical protein
MKTPILFLSGIVIAGCGNISDPSHGGEHVAAVSGALSTSGSVPANAHVALVWRTNNGPVVGADAPVVGGAFTIDLDVPPDSYFESTDGSSGTTGTLPSGSSSGSGSSSSSTGTTTPGSSGNGAVPTPPPTVTDAGVTGLEKIHPLDSTSGTIAGPLEVAMAGFAAYIDENGNGKLDISGETASSPDQLIAGANDLVLAYFRGGGPLDLQRLEDKSGKTPSLGYNLALTEGQWVALNLVELTLSTSPSLPNAICGLEAVPVSSGGPDPSAPTGGPGSTGTTEADAGVNGAGGPYPSPGDP